MWSLLCSPRLHLSTSGLCLQQQPTPSASEAHTSCLEAEKQIPFYLPCKSTDVQNVSKCTQTSLGFRHSVSLDDLFGIFIPIAFQADKLSFCSFTQELSPPHSFNPCVMDSTFVQSFLPCPSCWGHLWGRYCINHHLKMCMPWHSEMHCSFLDFNHIPPSSSN